jgi:hypothetical protein
MFPRRGEEESCLLLLYKQRKIFFSDFLPMEYPVTGAGKFPSTFIMLR